MEPKPIVETPKQVEPESKYRRWNNLYVYIPSCGHYCEFGIDISKSRAASIVMNAEGKISVFDGIVENAVVIMFVGKRYKKTEYLSVTVHMGAEMTEILQSSKHFTFPGTTKDFRVTCPHILPEDELNLYMKVEKVLEDEDLKQLFSGLLFDLLRIQDIYKLRMPFKKSKKLHGYLYTIDCYMNDNYSGFIDKKPISLPI